MLSIGRFPGPEYFLNSVGDVDLLPAVLRAADDLGAMPDDAPDGWA